MTDIFGDIPVAAPIFGDESDGDVVFSSNTTLGTSSYAASTFTVEAGVTLDMTGPLIVAATDTISINGVIDASGACAGPGGDAQFSPLGAGGEGGQVNGGGSAVGENGGDGDQTGPLTRRDLIRVTSAVLSDLNNGPAGAGGGAGGDGEQRDNYTGDTGDNAPGDSPGGGGAGGLTSTFPVGSGGNGGAGGGAVYLIAPNVRGSGEIRCDGEDGTDGNAGNAPGGGGGGGSGGLNAVFAEEYDFTGTRTAAGGTGGQPGTFEGGTSFAIPGEPGADGAEGIVITVQSN